MRKTLLFLALMLTCLTASAYNYDPRFPTWEINGLKFALTFQANDDCSNSVDVVVLQWDGSKWSSWGGPADVRGTIAECVTDEMILARGSLHQFVLWAVKEAVHRACARAIMPLPDPTNRIERLKYAILELITVPPAGNGLTVPPAPLP